MKLLFLTVITLLFAPGLSAQTSRVSGKIDSNRYTELAIFTIEEGVYCEFAKSAIAQDGRFCFEVEIPHEGFYMVGSSKASELQVPVYLKKGDSAQINLTFSPQQVRVDFLKNNTPENILVGEWLKLSQTAREKSLYTSSGQSVGVTFVDYFPIYREFLSQKAQFKLPIETPNPTFNRIMSQYVEFDSEYLVLNLLCTSRKQSPEANELPEFVTSMFRPGRFTDNTVLSTPNGARYLSQYVKVALFVEGKRDRDDKLVYLMTDELKGAILSNDLVKMETYEGYARFVNKYGNYFVTERQKQLVQKIEKQLEHLKPGNPAIDFTYPDISGKEVSLRDFIGKVVLVDVWATWCGPCKYEIPFLIKLEEELSENKDIIFMGVSVDTNREKWAKMVTEKGIKGYQLFAGGEGKISKDYNINGIPQFMIFDKKGNIYTADAPRPSSPELKALLLKLAAE